MADAPRELGLLLAGVVLAAAAAAVPGLVVVFGVLAAVCFAVAALRFRRRSRARPVGAAGIRSRGAVHMKNVQIDGFDVGVDAKDVRAQDTRITGPRHR